MLAEVKDSGHSIDMDCIYCKYSQFALKESQKVGLLQSVQLQQTTPLASDSALKQEDTLVKKTHDYRTEHLVKMFKTQLFKKSFIATSLLIIQRRMTETQADKLIKEKYMQQQREIQERKNRERKEV